MANKSTAFKCTLCLMLLTSFSNKSLLATAYKFPNKISETESRSNDEITPSGITTGGKNHLSIIVQSNQTILSWSTIEPTNGKYLIYRSEEHHNFVKIGEKTINTNPNEPTLYIFHDETPERGLNHYKLVRQEVNGNLKEIASKQVFLNAREPNTLSNIPIPRINRI